MSKWVVYAPTPVCYCCPKINTELDLTVCLFGSVVQLNMKSHQFVFVKPKVLFFNSGSETRLIWEGAESGKWIDERNNKINLRWKSLLRNSAWSFFISIFRIYGIEIGNGHDARKINAQSTFHFHCCLTVHKIIYIGTETLSFPYKCSEFISPCMKQSHFHTFYLYDFHVNVHNVSKTVYPDIFPEMTHTEQRKPGTSSRYLCR